MAQKKLSEMLRENSQSREQQLEYVARINSQFNENLNQQPASTQNKTVLPTRSRMQQTSTQTNFSLPVTSQQAQALQQTQPKYTYNVVNLDKDSIVNNILEMPFEKQNEELRKLRALGMTDIVQEAQKAIAQQQGKEKAEKINESTEKWDIPSILYAVGGLGRGAVNALGDVAATGESLRADNGIVRGQTSRDNDDMVRAIKLIRERDAATNANIDSGITRTATNVSETIGRMIPSIASNLLLPGSGIAVTGVTSGASSYIDTLNDDASNKRKALLTGVAKGAIEAATEKLFGGNILGRKNVKKGIGSIDKFAVHFIGDRIKSEAGQKIASKAYEFAGENLEEFLSDNLGNIVDKLINNKDLPSFQEWLSQTGETAKDTFLTTLALNMMGLGGNTYNEVQDYLKDKQAQTYLNEAQKIIKQENLTEKLKNDVADTAIQRAEESSQQTNNKNIALEELNKSRINEQEKQQMIDVVNNMETVTDEDLAAIRNTINETYKANMLPINENYKESQQRRQTYMKYKNDSSDYNSSVVNSVLDTIPANRNGNRTVKQWLQAADNIGQQLADLSNEEIEKIAYKSWFELQPTKNITQYDNQAKQKVGFQKLTSDEWVNKIYESVNKAREGQQTISSIPKTAPTQETRTSILRGQDGKEITVYHGSPNANITEFDNNMAGSNTQSDFEGIYFTDNPKIAEDFSYEQLPGNSNLTYKRGNKGDVYQKNLSFNNSLSLNNLTETDVNNLEKYIDDSKLDGISKEDALNLMQQMAKANNAQGVKFYLDFNKLKNDYDLIIADMGGQYKGSNEYIVFNNDQIKDVTNTVEKSKLPVQQQIQLNNLTNAEAPKQELPTKTENTDKKIAEVLDKPFKEQKPKQRTWAIIKANLVDKGAVFEDLSRKTNNRELQAKWDATLSSGARGQYAIGQDRYEFKDGKQNKISKSLESIISEVGENESDFQNYMYHQLNVDRMTLDQRYGIDNKPVFGDSIDAEYSRRKIADLEQEHPEFKEYAQDVYDFLNANKQAMVDSGIISQELSDELAKRYPHYVPIQRVGVEGAAINVPLDTKRTGVNAPLKRAKGGSQDIQPLFNTIADRTLQTYRAGARNSFGVELKNSLQQLNLLNQSAENINIDNVLDSVATDDTELLKKGEKGKNPTFTVFENGNKVTYDINEDMYDALKPKNELLRKLDDSKLSKAVRKFGDFRRGLLTEYNPIFSITNSLKDAPDVLMHSQHAIKTYKKFPEAYSQILGKGYYYQEYLQNGGEQNSYFNEGDFKIKEKGNKLDKLKMPLEMISKVNNVIEMAPRLAEYIASRESGRSVETSMLDAARVTTNFKAGGDVTKFANRNGATFLNAGVQGLAQNIRDIQEAHQKGFKGYAILAGKLAVAGLPAMILNHLVWRDDKDYEELQDYVKDNYYIIGKYGDGQFIRIPKGRTVAVVQKIVNNIDDFITNDKLDADKYASQFWKDLKEDIKFGADNLAPNNPIDNNIISPIIQAATNKTWYGEDLVPTRLQDKPKAEQYDESTDKFSRWLGEKTGISPVKINYLLDQYTGGVGDILLPMGTPQAENNAIEDKFTTNSVMKSRYPGEFFEKFDELNVQNNSEKATDEDKLKYKYFSSVRGQTSDLYKQKREIQNSNKSDVEKKKELLEVQKQINKLTKDALEDLDKVKVSGNTATIGSQEYYKYKDTWTKLKDEDKISGVSLKDYATWKNVTEGLTKESEKAQALVKSNISDSNKAKIYKNTIGKDDKYFDTAEKAKININNYLNYKANMGTTKASAMEYLNKSNIGYEQKLLLLGTKYALSSQEKSTLAKYINNLNITKSDKLDIYQQLKGFKVNGDKVSW